jgi:Tfp pilus assembly protein PilV
MFAAYGSIPLSGLHLQPKTPTEQFQGAASAMNTVADTKMRQQQTQSLAIQNQLAQNQLQQQQMFMRAMNPDSAVPGPSDGTQGPPAQPPAQPAQPVPPTPQPGQQSQPVPLSQIPGMTVMPPSTDTAGTGAVIGSAGAVPLSQAAASPQITGMPPDQMPPQPRQSPAQPQSSAQRPNFSGVGDRMQASLNRFMAMPGANPMFAISIYNGMIDQKTKMAGLDKDLLANEKATNDREAGALNSIAGAAPEDKNQMWTDHLNSQFQAGQITKQQYQQYVNNPIPTDTQLKTMANAKLLYSEQMEGAAKQATSDENLARAQNFRSEASARDLVSHAQVAIPTMPQDPQGFAAWKTQQPADVQKVLQNTTDPDEGRRLLQLSATPLDKQAKTQQDNDVAQIAEGRNIAAQGTAGAYGEFMGGLKHSNPKLYNQMPPVSGFDSKTYPDLINRIGLTPEQTSQAGNQSQNRDLRAQTAAEQENLASGRLANSVALLAVAQMNANTNAGRLGAQNQKQTTQQWENTRKLELADNDNLAKWGAELSAGTTIGGNHGGDPLTAADQQDLKDKIANTQAHNQQLQYDKARMMGIDPVDPNSVVKGRSTPSSNPAVQWTRNAESGIVYPESVPKTPAPPPAAKTPPPSPKPASQGNIAVTDPNGRAHYFPNQAAADKFKKLAGIQ